MSGICSAHQHHEPGCPQCEAIPDVSAKTAGQPEGQSSPKGIDQLAADVRYEITILFGPCGLDEALAFLNDIVDAHGDRLGAVYGMGDYTGEATSAELVSRLQTAEADANTLNDSYHDAMRYADEHLDRAEAAEAQVAALTQERDFWQGTANEMAETEVPNLVKRYRNRIRVAEARVANLTTALEEIEEDARQGKIASEAVRVDQKWPVHETIHRFFGIRNRARRALAESKE